ncbi:hypothetical protein GTA62_19700 [Roseobacter sp. HKCCD9010]|uniref:hypothetical protein n=1 Tax=unclassified Roseobacter TaxID=196798 RepID=UPI001491E98A|nr:MULTISPECIES: hypothetical protein [unclassified Roseobacter]MBF9052189.1 hypothetical protein [Rhodobacterales bacterium HKCCD4356]NNV14144.1 hypothetical protein [Roseobacter sp. HKCCD7357]NNV18368.1 hypothetical protein [Roseobacter sp. HKCCD8768]NNV27808.1 hypothetical protein [Roseobacter sp. HKCCD8192]NNV32088.1 hypothetical protein [Roseobacter sp. HKCCD9061]
MTDDTEDTTTGLDWKGILNPKWDEDRMLGVQERPNYGLNLAFEAPRDPPPWYVATRAWRDFCMAEKQQIPVGYTYFGQLIAHDIGNSVPLDHVPHSGRDKLRPLNGVPAVQSAQRYNLIENPLVLETLYGAGPAMLPHLFDPDTFRFRITPRRILSETLGKGDASVRALYDPRNRDTTMLHRLAVIWMKFHNLVAEEYSALMGGGTAVSAQSPGAVYAGARAHVVNVWHHLIRSDFLPRFVDPGVVEIARTQTLDLEETTLLHGVFRTFHALPRSSYDFGTETQSLSNLLLKGLRDKERKTGGWALDWAKFFDDGAGGSKTGISASMSPDLLIDHQHVLDLDLGTATDTGPLRLYREEIQTAVAKLPPAAQQQVDPKTMARNAEAKLEVVVTPESIANGPLFFALMLEAQLYGQGGRFGPLGSLLFQNMMETRLRKVVNAPSPSEALSRPNSMMELITLIREKEYP